MHELISVSLDFYEDDSYGWTERAGVWIGNNIFGTNYDTVYLYKCALMECMLESIESSQAEEVMTTIDFFFPFLVALNDKIDGIMSFKKDISEKDLLDIKEQISTMQKNITDLERAFDVDSGNSDVAKKQMIDWWIEISDSMKELKLEQNGISENIEVYKKIGKVTKVLSWSFGLLEIADEFKEFVDIYVPFVLNTEKMNECIYVLEVTSGCDNEKLTRACNELIELIKEQNQSNQDIFFGVFESLNERIKCFATKIAVNRFLDATTQGTYLLLVDFILGIGDFIFNFSEVAETSTYLYAIAKSAHVYAEIARNSMKDILLQSNDYGYNFYVEYDNVESVSDKFFNLSILRYCGERKMRETNKSYALLIELWLGKYIYNEEQIWDNMVELNFYLNHYWNCQPRFEW